MRSEEMINYYRFGVLKEKIFKESAIRSLSFFTSSTEEHEIKASLEGHTKLLFWLMMRKLLLKCLKTNNS